jgi:N6-L-threonylcarbamoyladenine synthase
MIGAAGYYDFIAGKRADMSLNAIPNLRVGENKGNIIVTP